MTSQPASYYRERYKDPAIRAKKLASSKKQYAVIGPGKHLKSRYGITEEDRVELLIIQGGCCKLCGRVRKLNVDHDHKSGKVRGLLCTPCNTMIGHIENHNVSTEDVRKYIAG